MDRHGSSTPDKVLHWARAYDLLLWACSFGRERRFRDQLLDLAGLAPGEAVLDVGCGTGTLAIAAKGRVGGAGQVHGVDPSPEMVARARRKAAKAGADVRFETASIEALPFSDATFDAVVSSLVLHHVSDEGRPRGIGEIARVVKPGGRFLAVDMGGRAEGKLHALLFRRGIHAHFDLDELVPVLDRSGLQVTDRGPVESRGIVGLSNLRFIRATATRPPART